ncbi:RimJ/RimL family protein N-acetyltransferase [Rhizomicrobium palustre]|uniref:RimJ/RimL family protein N-acetyltransferase n=1 Tax=Rhizomicrobium palustre TaxID=189966 RepID=A0A846N060_9PROT|nr:GNAT family N-acetyltransferase [Rhizomicrobium palustre]NIK88642.1 RimJ/RimL family protein N-acetyltransferase [Rhizomicrobium palustre]
MTRLDTQRLLLSAPEESDLAAFALGLGDFTVAKNLATAPHPYDESDAKAFLSMVTEARARGEAYVFAIRKKEGGETIGCCGLNLKDGRFQLGYWIAKPYWKQGFATEAAARLLHFAFDVLKADEVWAGWYHDNLASGRVLGKLGFQASHVEKQFSRARAEAVLCNRTRLTAAHFERKKALFTAPRQAPHPDEISGFVPTAIAS